MQHTHYATLGLSRDSLDEALLKKQYRLLCRTYHPDRNLGREEEVAEKFKAVQEAYSVLSDPESRREYNSELDKRRESVPRASMYRCMHGWPGGRGCQFCADIRNSGRAARAAAAARKVEDPPTSNAEAGMDRGKDRRNDGGRGRFRGEGSNGESQFYQPGRVPSEVFERASAEDARRAANARLRRGAAAREAAKERVAAQAAASGQHQQSFASPGSTGSEGEASSRQASRDNIYSSHQAPIRQASHENMHSAEHPPRRQVSRENVHGSSPSTCARGVPKSFAAGSRAPPARGSEWEGLDEALAVSAHEAASNQEAEEAEILRQIRLAEQREAAEIKEALRLVEEAMTRENREQEELEWALQAVAAMTANESNSFTANENEAVTTNESSPSSPSGAEFGHPSGSQETAQPARTDEFQTATQQLRTLVELGFPKEVASRHCDGVTPIEELVEKIVQTSDQANRDSGERWSFSSSGYGDSSNPSVTTSPRTTPKKAYKWATRRFSSKSSMK